MVINKILIEFHVAIHHLYIMLCIHVTSFVLFFLSSVGPFFFFHLFLLVGG